MSGHANACASGGHYSHVVVANGFVFVSGQLPITALGEKLIDASFEVQAWQVLKNVEQALLAAGTGIEQLVQVRIYLDDIAHWPAFNDIYAQWAGSARPARAIVPTGPLHFGLKIEIEVTALSVATAT
ncbi:RidA family protein [Glaciimonas sp. PAMC28666]|uniref:RidA family protein n=1 Tax=Glaciimonas sp. PAMC28666 TaxID=2807626 RepID=UPI001F04A7F3|nr:RidA family protein [Glaciimonas sp. PAMC28666]